MSRCFPFPPPDYVWKVGGESLAELLKLRRLGALAWNRKAKKHKRKDKTKSSEERKCRKENGERYKLKRVKADNKRNEISKRRKCETTTRWSESSSLSQELERLTPCDCISNSREYIQNISKFLSFSPSNVINDGNDACNVCPDDLLQIAYINGHQVPFCSNLKKVGSICQDNSLMPSERAESSPQQQDDCALSSGLSQSSGILQSQSEIWDPLLNWVPPPVEMEDGNMDDLDWLMNAISYGKSTRNQAQTTSVDYAPSDRYPLYPSSRYLPEADIYALPYTMVF